MSQNNVEVVKLPDDDWKHFRLLLKDDSGTTNYLKNLKEVVDLYLQSKEDLLDDLALTPDQQKSLDRLENLFENHIRENTRVDTVLQICEAIYGKVRDTLEEDTCSYLARNVEAVLEQDYFLGISKEVLLEILSSDSLAINESKLFKAAYSWAICQILSDNSFDLSVSLSKHEKMDILRDTLGDCLSEIRFSLVKPREILVEILTEAELVSLNYYWERQLLTKPDDRFSTQKRKKDPSDVKAGIIFELSPNLKVKTHKRSRDRLIVLSPYYDYTTLQFCDGSEKFVSLEVRKDILIKRLTFCGPLHKNSEYTVKVWKRIGTREWEAGSDICTAEKITVFAKRGHPFEVQLSTPIVILHEAGLQTLRFTLVGPPTGGIKWFGDDIASEEKIGDDMTINFGKSAVQLIYISYTLG